MRYKISLKMLVAIITLMSIMSLPIYAAENGTEVLTTETKNISQQSKDAIQPITIINPDKKNQATNLNSVSLQNTAPFKTISGKIETQQDSFTYPIELDFTNTSQVAICLVETGDGYVAADIKDSNDNLVKKLGAGKSSIGGMGNYNCINWCLIDKPNPDVDIYTYNISVYYYPNTNLGSGNSYNIHYGNSSYLEEMTSGQQNTINLFYYSYRDINDQIYDNSYYSSRTPSMGVEHWYKFKHQLNKTIVTVGPRYGNSTTVRFKIIDPESQQLIYDSNTDITAHKTNWLGGHASIEKKAFDNSNLTMGKEYNLVIYSPSGSISPMSQGYNLFVGQGALMSDSTTVYAANSVTSTYTSYSTPVNLRPTNVPENTAMVTDVSFKSATSGVTMSKIKPFEVRLSTDSMWISNTQFNSKIKIPYSYGQATNKRLATIWQLRYKASSNSVTCKPGLYFNYEYEIGD